MEIIQEESDQIIISNVLLKKAVGGDNNAFKMVYDFLSEKMYAVCLRYAGNNNDANDFFQEGFIRLYKHLESYRFEGSFEGWARRVFVTTCLDMLKQKRIAFQDVSESEEIPSRETAPIEKLQMADLLKLIQNLPPSYRTIINLYIIEGYTHKEIAQHFGFTESGSKSQLHKARLYLKNILSV